MIPDRLLPLVSHHDHNAFALINLESACAERAAAVSLGCVAIKQPRQTDAGFQCVRVCVLCVVVWPKGERRKG